MSRKAPPETKRVNLNDLEPGDIFYWYREDYRTKKNAQIYLGHEGRNSWANGLNFPAHSAYTVGYASRVFKEEEEEE